MTVTARRLAVVLATVALAAPAACASVDVPESLPGPTTSTTEAPASTGPPPDCGNPVASLRPSGPATGTVAGGSYMAEIQERGRLRVGVDVATFQLSSVDPLTGRFQGFDVDIANEVAIALFGDASPEHIEFVGIPSSERIPALTDGAVRVDMVASAFTVNCARREDIAFSTEYFHAGQRVLVRTDDAVLAGSDDGGESPAADPVEALQRIGERDGTVCVSAGSTAIGNIEGLGLADPPAIEPAPQRADCLVRLQQGQTDALVTDDAILAGMAAQDPSLGLVTDGDTLSDEPYGLGLPPDRPEWVRYVNAVLEDVRESGRWDALYAEWLEPLLGPQQAPAAVYED